MNFQFFYRTSCRNVAGLAVCVATSNQLQGTPNWAAGSGAIYWTRAVIDFDRPSSSRIQLVLDAATSSAAPGLSWTASFLPGRTAAFSRHPLPPPCNNPCPSSMRPLLLRRGTVPGLDLVVGQRNLTWAASTIYMAIDHGIMNENPDHKRAHVAVPGGGSAHHLPTLHHRFRPHHGTDNTAAPIALPQPFHGTISCDFGKGINPDMCG
ncbi:uncharacterized protein LOC129595209 [Paramacrobiotus metropolitanus]|uniref:uncharacterized protein LOC129595209 n=1 Tax=Paramacrobiotus metropolitanus TaxID=2943436 RepID=UPI0024459AFB|nr:uncharacterized protein LOC129595209 [Paramacrobiotus metropolitanus]